MHDRQRTTKGLPTPADLHDQLPHNSPHTSQTTLPGGRDEPLPPPKCLDEFLIREELARGGAGVVYRAWDQTLERQVAVKVLRAVISHKQLSRFRSEAIAAAGLKHPNIVTIYHVGGGEGTLPYIVMDLVEGRTLSQLIRYGGPMKEERAAQLMAKVADALAFAHQHGILHRDIKPGNIMVTPEKEPVVTDFGLARDQNRNDRRLTSTGRTVGTPAYMSPEQVMGDCEVRSDVYALGATLYAALTGQAPFEGPTPVRIMTAVLEQTPEPPSKLRENLDPRLEAICLKCLEKDPEKRYPSAHAVAEDLRHYLQDDEVAAVAVFPWRQLLAWLSSKSANLFKAGLFLLLMGNLALWWSMNSPRAEPVSPTPPAQPDGLSPAAAPTPPPSSPERSVRAEGPSAEGLLGLAQEHYSQREYQQAIDAYSRALEHTTRLSEADLGHAYLGRGRARARLGNLELSFADYAQVISRNASPVTTSQAHMERARAHAKAGNDSDALQDYAEALRLDPLNAEAHCFRSKIWAKQGDLERAVGDTTAAISLNPTYGSAFFDRGKAYARLEKWQSAVDDFTRVIELETESESLVPNNRYYRRGRAQFALGNHRAAISDFKQVLRQDPDASTRQLAETALAKAELALAGAE